MTSRRFTVEKPRVRCVTAAAAATVASLLALGTESGAQIYPESNYVAQSYGAPGYPQYGRTYNAKPGWNAPAYPNNQNSQGYANPTASGFGGRANNTSFSSGFGGFSQQAQPAAHPTYQQPNYAQPNRSQGGSSTMAGLEQMLNAVDSKQGWNRTPVTVPAQQPMQPAMPAQNAMPMGMPNTGSPMMPRISRREMTRIFFEGGSPMGGMGSGAFGGGAPANNPANNSANTSTAYSNYQTAVNEETKSRNYANTARYDSSEWNRKNAASQAEYAANNANYAAQRAESAAYNGDSQARGYANMARAAANRARENANRARYNADTIR